MGVLYARVSGAWEPVSGSGEAASGLAVPAGTTASIPNGTFTAINLGTPVWNDAAFTISGTTATCTKPARYLIIVQATPDVTLTTAQRLAIQIQVNAANLSPPAEVQGPGAGASTRMQVSATANLANGDAVRIRVWANPGAAYGIDTTLSSLRIERL